MDLGRLEVPSFATVSRRYRTTILLDDESRRAARELALRLDCSTSEAIRTAILRYREQVFGVAPEARKARTRALLKLIELSEGMDPEEEIRRLQGEIF